MMGSLSSEQLARTWNLQHFVLLTIVFFTPCLEKFLQCRSHSETHYYLLETCTSLSNFQFSLIGMSISLQTDMQNEAGALYHSFYSHCKPKTIRKVGGFFQSKDYSTSPHLENKFTDDLQKKLHRIRIITKDTNSD